MPKNKVSDLITDQEIAFARLILSGKMTDRQAAEAVGLNPDSAAYTKSKPRVRAYMLEHRAAVEQQLVEQDTQEQRRFNVSRDQILARLWEIANLDPERTRNSMSSQVKALSMIVAIEGLIPDRHSDRRAVSAQNQPATPPVNPPFYVAEWGRTQQHGESGDPQPPPPPVQKKDDQQDAQQAAGPDPQSAPGRANDPPVSGPTPDISESIFPGLEPLANDIIATSRPYVRFVPDARAPFSIDKNPVAWRR
jgi:hypothetical protein